MNSIRRLVAWAKSAAILMAIASLVHADPPPISDPDMRAPVGSMPGTFPETVTASNVNAAPIPGSEIGGSGSDNIKVTFPAAGPIKWTESRHNEGDFAMQIGPFDPNDPSYYPPDAFVNDYKPLEGGQPFANTTLAWRVNRDNGALLATVRHNGVNNQDTYLGQPVGTTHGVAYFNADFGQGWGYRMTDGVFANGGGNSADLQMGVAGYDEGLGEAVFSTAVAMLPYAEGWLGAYVNSADSGIGSFSSANPDVDESSVVWNSGIATVNLPGVDPLNDGMLFVAPTNGNNATDIAAATPTSGGWQVTIREDDDFDTTGQTYNGVGDNGFQFVYLPYDATGMIGAHVAGSDGSLINSAGDEQFTVTRRAAGEYAIQVMGGPDDPKTENDGMLVLSVAGALPGSSTLADRKFLSYEFDANSNEFVVQSREVVETQSSMSDNIFGDLLALRDVDFYFAYVDFTNPFRLSSLGCDFDGDGSCGLSDIDQLIAAIAAGTNDAQFDLTGDGLVDTADRDAWLADAGEVNLGAGQAYIVGDANLDGFVDVSDFNIWNNNKFTNTAKWSQADFNADGVTDVPDFNLWNNTKFTSSGTAAVPEPGSLSLVLLLLSHDGRHPAPPAGLA